MSDPKSNSSGAPAPFVLRGSTSLFSQRQLDVFGGLQALEDAHNKVTKETRSERHLVKKMAWKETKPAAESLEADKEAREKQNASAPPVDNTTEVLFKVPDCPPPRSALRRKRPARASHHVTDATKRDSQKWTHYSLADVDEDAGLGGQANRKIAADLMRELRRRREEASESEPVEDLGDDDRPARIIFRPTRGTKRSRVESSGPSPVNLICSQSHDDDDVDEQSDDRSNSPDPTNHQDDIAFRPRTQHGKLRCRTGSKEDVRSDEEVETRGSTEAPEAADSGSSDETTDDLEDAPEGL
ncbi:unnamed protein product [Mesocestoides corti]|uniref:Protein TSSC4 n=1 Tax=Mesocestoides corti TaxID=53468 RepID=A0A0R3UN78_MESCO|nr:unnamed protein product [Mesocestoides corti]